MSFIVVTGGFVQTARDENEMRRILRDEMSASEAETFLRELETDGEARFFCKNRNKLIIAYSNLTFENYAKW